MKPICRHCRDPRKKVNRPRRLCWNCYHAPGVRDLYPSESKFGRRGSGSRLRFKAPLPESPTTAPPASPEKVAVLEARAAAGTQLFHPADARWPGDPRPLAFLQVRPPSAVA